MNVEEVKRQQIYEVIENPNLSKEEKVDMIAKILNKTDKEITKETYEQKKKIILEDIYHSLFNNKEGKEHENKKNK